MEVLLITVIIVRIFLSYRIINVPIMRPSLFVKIDNQVVRTIVILWLIIILVAAIVIITFIKSRGVVYILSSVII